ncbi:hypothetical protein NLM16_37305, partial [Bradyrhizobium brasilense]|uniref:hypothetical protein n=1 Tax=Bradyrhizobium brasilense TaxID=1419277 RepID=UPI0028780CD8
CYRDIACSALCVSTTRKDRFASVLPSMHRDTVNHSPDTPAFQGEGEQTKMAGIAPGHFVS